MLDPAKLRKADIFTGLILVVFGAWVMAMAFRMPMKDSYGGVMNVWYVSPALFPLMVGAAIAILGIILIAIAVKSVGSAEAVAMFGRFFTRRQWKSLLSEANYRFMAITFLLLFYVFVSIPHVDFMICSTQFLVVSILLFYFDDTSILKRLFRFHAAGSLLFFAFCLFAGNRMEMEQLVRVGDLFNLALLAAFVLYAWLLVRDRSDLRRKFVIGWVSGVLVPLLLCPIFKYFLLVPLPQEGLAVALLDSIYYAVF